MKEEIENAIKHTRGSVEDIILDTMNDINEYFTSDVPIENYQEDIDDKLSEMKYRILNLFD